MADDPVSELYGLPLDEFVAGRNSLARELRKEGEKERAADVAKLEKPSVSAWAVNQLARSERKQLDLLLDAGHRLRGAQEEILKGGDRNRFETARRDHDRAVRELVGRTKELLEEERGAATDQILSRIEGTLRYASIDEEQRALLAAGRLTTDVEAPGFAAFTGIAVPPAPADRAPPSPQRRKQPSEHSPQAKPGPSKQDRLKQDRVERQSRVAAARETLKLARDEEQAARRLLRQAEQDERKAARAFERATTDLEAARTALDDAKASVAKASDRVQDEGKTGS